MTGSVAAKFRGASGSSVVMHITESRVRIRRKPHRVFKEKQTPEQIEAAASKGWLKVIGLIHQWTHSKTGSHQNKP
jgi:hypothetical protein